MKLVCLGIILLTYVYGLILDIIDLKSANNPIHEKVSDIYNEENYKKWRMYKKDGVISSIIFSSVQFLVIALLLGFDVYALVGNAVGSNSYVTTLVTIGLYLFIAQD